MSEADSSVGVGKDQIEAALADPAFASLRLAGAPVVVIAGAPGRVVYATETARSLFGGDLTALGRRLLHGGEPGASRIVALSRSLLPGAAPRLERLRFFFGPVAETVTFLCRRIAVANGETLFALAALGLRAPPAPANRSDDEKPTPVLTLAPAPEAIEHAPAVLAHAAALANIDEQVAERAQPGVAPPTPPVARGARFAWRTDGDHIIASVSSALADQVGAANADVVGQSFVEAAQRLRLDESGRLVAALAARDTFSGIETLWPAADGLRARVTLGAAPAYDAEDRFEGFRGYGVVGAERVAAPAIPGDEAQSGVPAAEHLADAATARDVAHQDNADSVAREIDHIAQLAESASPPLAVERDVLSRGEREAIATNAVRAQAGQDENAADLAPRAAGHEAPGEQASDGEDDDEIVAVTDAGEALHRGEVGANPPGAVHESDAQQDIFEDETVDDDTPATPAPAQTSRAKIVPLRPQQPQRVATPEPATASVAPSSDAPRRSPAPELSPGERSAFEEIARALGAEPQTAPSPEAPLSPAANRRARDLIDLVARFGRSDEPAIEQSAAPPPRTPPLAVVPPDAPSSTASTPLDAAAGNAAHVLDRLPVGVVVSRFNVPIFANRTVLDLLDYADVDAFHAAGGLDRLFRGRAPDSGAAQVETREGEMIPVDARVQAIDWDGQPATLITLRRAQDAADGARAKALELELRQRDAEARELHSILDTATDGVVVLDSEGRILSLNRAGEALFGYDQNEVAGEPFAMLVAKESGETVGQYFDGVKSGGVQSVLNDGREVFGRARQGGTIPLFMTLGRLGAGATPKFCAVLKDLTAWKKVERELGDARREAERASALKSDFLAKVSHEIRTPLNAILGFAEVIMDERFGPVGNARYRDYMRDIHKSGEHVLSLVNDLLDLSKIEAGKVDLTFTSVDVNAIVAECVSLMQPQANRDRVVVRLSLAPNLPNIVADERSMRQIVLNILSNAVKFNEPGGQVIVSTALTDAGHAVVRIKDTGVGMSDEDLETALEPFRQVTTARKNEGTGLGLPLTKALVEANRASFTIKSRKGEGTLVEVVFPPTRVLAE